MRIGVPKEIKDLEERVGLTPAACRTLVAHGHSVAIEDGAGGGAGYDNAEYRNAGCSIVPSAAAAWDAEMVVKVKEPLPSEFAHLRADLILMAYLHLAANEALTRALLDNRVSAIAFETVELADGTLPILVPMSEIAGRLAIQEAAFFLKTSKGGRGVLLAGLAGAAPARVVVIGAGTSGTAAAKLALAMGAEVTVLDINERRLRDLAAELGGARTEPSTPVSVAEFAARADVVVGAVLVRAARAPKVLTKVMVKAMQPGSVVVDLAVDQGGCFETTRPTSLSDPVYAVDGVIHYAVPNMPGSVPRTSTQALVAAALPYILTLAAEGMAALERDAPLRAGLNTMGGEVTCKPVADAHGLPWGPPLELVKSR